MRGGLDNVSCASLPKERLAFLGDIRCAPGVAAAVDADQVWLRWHAGDSQVLLRILGVPGVQLYVNRQGLWHRHGCFLPAFDFPVHLDFRPLAHVLLPARVEPLQATRLETRPLELTLVTESRPRPATALLCVPAELARWADTVSEARLRTLRAVQRPNQVLVLGPRLPLLAGDHRFWGEGMLIPLGFRLDPDVPENIIRQALAVTDPNVLLWNADGVEAVPRSLLQPLTRTRVRLLCLAA